MFKLVIATEFENLPGFTTPNYVLMHMHPLLARSLLQQIRTLNVGAVPSNYLPYAEVRVKYLS